MKPALVCGSLVLAIGLPALASAQEAPPPLPWLMRPTGATTALRSDTAIADFDGGVAMTTLLQANLQVRPTLAVGARVAYNLVEPEQGDTGHGLANPVVFALWAPRLETSVRPAFFAAAVMPVGEGAGAEAAAGERMAMAAGLQTRQGMDNALFSTNYTTAIVGVGASVVRGPLAFVAEATVLQLFRVYEPPTGTPVDDVRTNFTSGVHAAWTFWGPLTVSGELHLQRWLYAPELLDADLAYSRGIDEPMQGQSYQIVSVDLPVIF
jgi:hypothetical protein